MADSGMAELIDRVVAYGRAQLPDDAKNVEVFLRQYFDRTAPDDLCDRSEVDLLGTALAHWDLARQRAPGEAGVRAYLPDFETDGWRSTHTAIDVVSDDRAFLVDSITNELSRHDLRVHVVIYPVIRVRRDAEGHLLEVLDSGTISEDMLTESFVHIEVDRQRPRDLKPLERDVRRVLEDVRRTGDDWPAMRQQAERLAATLPTEPCPDDPDDVAEAATLLAWLADDHFTFIGYREYDLIEEDGDDVLRAVPGTGLGILREERHTSPSFSRLSPSVRQRARDHNVLVLAKANSRATVHRSSYLDYVGVKRFGPDGEVIGERRFLGLYSAAAYNFSVFDVPVIRRKVQAVVERAGLPVNGHSGRKLVSILENYPRDELFQIGVDELFDHAMGILRMQDRPRVRLFVRHDGFDRYVSCLVFVPRDRYNTAVRRRMTDILLDAFSGTGVDFTANVTESLLARLHFVVHTTSGRVSTAEVHTIEALLGMAVRTWSDDLYDALIAECGEQEGVALFHSYGDAFPAAYREDFPVRTAVADIRRLDALAPGRDLTLSLYRPPGAARTSVRLKIYRTTRISLSGLVPLFENMGVTVVDERPYGLSPAGGPQRWVYDFGLQVSEAAGDQLDSHRELFLEALRAVWRGEAESDGFNRLVLEAGIPWRAVAVLRACHKYLRQIGTTFSQAYIEQCLAKHPDLVRLLMEIFVTRFHPAFDGDRDAEVAHLDEQMDEGLDGILSLDEDRILRSFRHVLHATLRTNFYQHDAEGEDKPYLAFKLDPTAIPGVPLPLPMAEIFVYSPLVEGVHLRGGKVARGGIRWSDRREDFRTEVLGLMKAQMVKNSMIVPSGAKGGFVVKYSAAGGDRERARDEAIGCYRTFIAGLLDLTDDLVDGHVVPPADVVRYDGDDTYLVVAADKGTATFSDIANEIAVGRGFWLGDAFASGGSSGYDHKKMGITARGAWESVKRHFRDEGIDVQTTDVTVVGIGDMSGDVFGNGMLLSEHLRLVAAFDHRHIFVDPTPDAASSFAERARLFALPVSSWDSYDRSLISAGGGVFPRTAKAISLTDEMRAALAVDAPSLTPTELIRAILVAPVDLFWNGGIGTYVKASTESHADVGDKANDAVRVNGADLRARVVGEGGNLGFTQRGRVEYARRGGRIFTDAIDNSAGVDCSDHEVNLKILLNGIVAAGDLTMKQRDQLLIDMEDDVARDVVYDNYASTQALRVAAAQAGSLADVHARYIAFLERAGRLLPALEFLPSQEELTERLAEDQGLLAPELAVLLAYTKIWLAGEVEASDLPEDPFVADLLADYFPPLLREGYADRIQAHPLRREILATMISSQVVNRGGTSFLYRLYDETRAPVPLLARCHLVASTMFDMDDLWGQIEALDNVVDADTQTAMLLASRRLIERGTRWLVQHRHALFDRGTTGDFFAPLVTVLGHDLPDLLRGDDRDRYQATVDDLVRRHVPPALARRVAVLENLFSALDIIEVAEQTGHDLGSVASAYFALAHRLRFDWLRDQIALLPRDDRWRTLARMALRADLFNCHRALTAQVVSGQSREIVHPSPDAIAVGSDGAAEPADPLVTWEDDRRTELGRYDSVLTDLRAGSSVDLAVLSVAVRAVHDLAETF